MTHQELDDTCIALFHEKNTRADLIQCDVPFHEKITSADLIQVVASFH